MCLELVSLHDKLSNIIIIIKSVLKIVLFWQLPIVVNIHFRK